MNNRMDQFKQDIDELKLKTSGSGGEQNLLKAGIGLMLLGVVLGAVGYVASTNATDARDQNEYIILSVLGLAVTVAGAAVFLRYSLARFLRFWLLRQLYEGQDQVDRLVRELKG